MLRIWPDRGRCQKDDIGVTGARRGWPSLLQVYRKLTGGFSLAVQASHAIWANAYLRPAVGLPFLGSFNPGEAVVRKRPYPHTRLECVRQPGNVQLLVCETCVVKLCAVSGLLGSFEHA